MHEISPQEVQRLFPLCQVDDVLAGFYVEDDGRVNPVDVTAALSKGARMRGARIFENTTFLGVNAGSDGSVASVETSKGTIRCEKVVNACGMYARQVGEMSGIAIPNQAAEHYYLVTDAMPDVDPSWPVIEDPSSHTYIRPEGAGLMVGLFEPEAAAWCVDGVPSDFEFGQIEPDWDRMAPFLEKAMSRVPSSASVGMKTFSAALNRLRQICSQSLERHPRCETILLLLASTPLEFFPAEVWEEPLRTGSSKANRTSI